MRRLIGIVGTIIVIGLVGGSAASANVPTCQNPKHLPHHGEILPLRLWLLEASDELYLESENAPVGCGYVLYEEPESDGQHMLVAAGERRGGFVPFEEFPYYSYTCFQLWQVDITPNRISNWLCFSPLESERIEHG